MRAAIERGDWGVRAQDVVNEAEMRSGRRGLAIAFNHIQQINQANWFFEMLNPGAGKHFFLATSVG